MDAATRSMDLGTGAADLAPTATTHAAAPQTRSAEAGSIGLALPF